MSQIYDFNGLVSALTSILRTGLGGVEYLSNRYPEYKDYCNHEIYLLTSFTKKRITVTIKTNNSKYLYNTRPSPTREDVRHAIHSIRSQIYKMRGSYCNNNVKLCSDSVVGYKIYINKDASDLGIIVVPSYVSI